MGATALVRVSEHPAAASNAMVAPPSGCSDVLLLGARGSGQKEGQALGYGQQVNNMRALIARALGDLPVPRTVTAVPLKKKGYPAHAVGMIASPFVGPLGYLVGIEAAAIHTVGLLKKHAGKCRDQRIVLVGYSQGAMVMHRSASLLLQKNMRAVFSRIDGIVLLADGYRARRSRTHLVGNADWSREGIGNAVLALAKPPDVGAPLAGVTWSVCRKFDLVCDFRPQLLNASGLVSSVGGARIHTGPDYKNGAMVNAVAAEVVKKIRDTPKATPKSLLMNGSTHTPINHTLAADVTPRRTVEWRFAPDAVVPDGLKLTRRGKASGYFRTPFSSRVTVQYRTTGGKWQDASLSVHISEDGGGNDIPSEPPAAAFAIDRATDLDGQYFVATPSARGAWLVWWQTDDATGFRWIHADGTRGAEIEPGTRDLRHVTSVASMSDGSIIVTGWDNRLSSSHDRIYRFGPSGVMATRDLGGTTGGEKKSVTEGTDGYLYLYHGRTVQRLHPKTLTTLATLHPEAGPSANLAPTADALVVMRDGDSVTRSLYRIPYSAFDDPATYDPASGGEVSPIAERDYALAKVAKDGTVVDADINYGTCAEVQVGYRHANGKRLAFTLAGLAGKSDNCRIEDIEALSGGSAAVLVTVDNGGVLAFFDRNGEIINLHEFNDDVTHMTIRADGDRSVFFAYARWRYCPQAPDDLLAFCPSAYLERYDTTGTKHESQSLGDMTTPAARNMWGVSAISPGASVVGISAFRYLKPARYIGVHYLSSQVQETFEVLPFETSRIPLKPLYWY
ncbi:cutinase family protein [Nocardioides ochotonae]|uniref:cutinase family protein n=1 Tax=Nocardioides ochotonae TaxID=2685869 RepID=UPI00140B0A6E|nr:cutinase family protein [Nocardioides ochotonae]